MSVLIESTQEAMKPARKTVSEHKLNYRKNNGSTRDSSKKPSVVRRTKKNLNNQNFRHSIHEISGSIKDLDLKKEEPVRTEKVRLKRSRSFHVPAEHHQTNIRHEDRTEIIKQFLASNYDTDFESLDENIKKYDPLDGSFPIHDAIQIKHERNSVKELSLLLLRNEQANLEQTNNEGQTPLQLAVTLEQHDVVRLLIAFGASVTCKDNYGDTALRNAVDNGDFEMASLLISSGANAAVVQNGF